MNSLFSLKIVEELAEAKNERMGSSDADFEKQTTLDCLLQPLSEMEPVLLEDQQADTDQRRLRTWRRRSASDASGTLQETPGWMRRSRLWLETSTLENLFLHLPPAQPSPLLLSVMGFSKIVFWELVISVMHVCK